eukprot:345083-Amphidinium_carterae.1
MDTPCSQPFCEDSNATCCRAGTASEVASLTGNYSDAVSEGCLTTTTTTTTTTTIARLQMVGVATFEVHDAEFNSSVILEAWQAVLADLTTSSLENVWLFAGELPDDTSRSWQVGYQ